jgi:hypothetical protein
MEMLHTMNAKHAQEHANCTKAETLALHKKNAAAAAAAVRGLGDAELSRSATVMAGMPAMSVEQMGRRHPHPTHRRASRQYPHHVGI